ncbi:uncharacterized protein LOC142324666 [Lycorma delicatula]|uniref:uncharacterized protein LOC142324666 n=1 Tax=Lycorma delicatula TaxID=130591 RepID=UPI003F510B63
MYRQILVTQRDSNLQRILWRENPEQDLKHYSLRTVTYGTTSASFLATRCLVQIANDNNNQFPNACRAILNDFYVDDLITGADSVHEIKQLKTDVCNLLKQSHWTHYIFIQSLWQVKCNWDDTLPDNLLSQWRILYNQLSLVSSINVDRCVKLSIDSSIKSFQLHGFADASLKGFGCRIYVRITHCNDKVSCNLLCSKSRVAPLRQMTLPRLELCACLLLSCLLNQVTLALNERINEIHLYSDSMIALHWIHGQSTKWKVFVANRVSEIQQLTSNAMWHHTESPSNPVDILSRGCLPEKLINFVLWWHGPSWLLQDSSCWPTNHHFNSTEKNVDPQCLVEKRQTVQFIQNITHKSTNDRKFDALSSNELEFTLEFFIYQSQIAYFKSEINDLQNQRFISKQSKLSLLDPFLDGKGLLRVGGRLEHSNLSFDKKHQLILHSHANITRLIIHSKHLLLLHAGLQLTHSSLRQRFWIVNAKIAIGSVVRKCLKCFHFNADKQSQQLDPEPLTPGHFLIGSPLTSFPDPDFSEIPENRLGRWQLLQKFIQVIWKRWSKDYMQQRNKWRFPNRNLCEGNLVLVCDDNTSPLFWKSGIVTHAFMGSDNLVKSC